MLLSIPLLSLIQQLGGHYRGLKAWTMGPKDIGCHYARDPHVKITGLKYGWKAKNHGLPQGSVIIPEEDVFADPSDATRLLLEAFSRIDVVGTASGASASSRSPRSENKQQKR
nr:uncharacterized protein LOC104097580 [Nicotiana tomentosiformis]